MAKILTESLEDYLEAIAELCNDNGHAHTKEIAEKLKVKMPSVTGALRQLADMGHIVYNTHYPVTLTPEGKSVAIQVAKRHQILKKFFMDILGMPAANASDAACHLEHLIDEDTAAKLILFSEAIENRSDAANLRTFLSDAMELLSESGNNSCRTLNSLASGESAVIRKIGRNVLQPEKLGFAPGDKVTVNHVPLDKTHLHLNIDGKEIEIDLAVAENIFI